MYIGNMYIGKAESRHGECREEKENDLNLFMVKCAVYFRELYVQEL